MRIKSAFYLFVALISNSSCSGQVEHRNNQITPKLKVHIDTLEVFHKGDFSDLFASTKIVSKSEEDYYVMSYCYEDSLKYLKMSNMHMGSVYRGMKQNECKQKSSFSLTDEEGGLVTNHQKEIIYKVQNNEVVDSVNLNDQILPFEDIYVNNYIPYCSQDFNLPYNELFIRVLPLNENKNYKKKTPIPKILIFNYNSKSYELIYHYDKRLNNPQYGYLASWYYYINTDEKIYMSFRSDGEIDIYDRKSRTWESKNVKSKHDNGFQPYMMSGKRDTKNAKFLHSKLAHRYHSLVYNQHTKMFYRVFSKKLPKFDEDGLLNDESNRENFLMIFNDSLELIDEVSLPNVMTFYALLPIEDGVMIRMMLDTKKVDKDRKKGIFAKYLRIRHEF